MPRKEMGFGYLPDCNAIRYLLLMVVQTTGDGSKLYFASSRSSISLVWRWCFEIVTELAMRRKTHLDHVPEAIPHSTPRLATEKMLSRPCQQRLAALRKWQQNKSKHVLLQELWIL